MIEKKNILKLTAKLSNAYFSDFALNKMAHIV